MVPPAQRAAFVLFLGALIGQAVAVADPPCEAPRSAPDLGPSRRGVPAPPMHARCLDDARPTATPRAAGEDLDLDFKVIGGADAARLPFLTDDVVAVGSSEGWHCSGTLVGEDLVLTAAHCLPAKRVGLGNDVSRLVAEVPVASETAHPELDAALLRLAAPVPSVIPRAVGETDWYPLGPLGMVRIVGFGADDPTGRLGFGTKRVGQVPVGGWGCDSRDERVRGCLPGEELVVPSLLGVDSCRGDSGGPLLARRPPGKGDGAQDWVVVGVTSRSVGNATRGCGDGGVYVRADRLVSWIEEHRAEGSER